MGLGIAFVAWFLTAGSDSVVAPMRAASVSVLRALCFALVALYIRMYLAGWLLVRRAYRPATHGACTALQVPQRAPLWVALCAAARPAGWWWWCRRAPGQTADPGGLFCGAGAQCCKAQGVCTKKGGVHKVLCRIPT